MCLRGQAAVISGGASGIGLAIATELLRKDVMGLVIADIDESLAKKALKQLHKEFAPDRVVFVKVDVTNEDQYEEAFKKSISSFGGVDIVVNNAGIMDEKNFTKTIDINLTGKIRGTRLGLKYMSRVNGRIGGIILNISSMEAMNPAEFLTVYSASKCGVLGMSLNYGKESLYKASGVKVIALCPGLTTTKLIMEHKTDDKLEKKMFKECIAKLPKQTVQSVANAAIYTLENADSGTAWVINGGKLYKTTLPDWNEYAELVKDNI